METIKGPHLYHVAEFLGIPKLSFVKAITIEEPNVNIQKRTSINLRSVKNEYRAIT